MPPNRWCVRTVEFALLVLPAGEVRRRYERELIAELYGLSTRRQATFAAMTLVFAWSLRRSVTGAEAGGPTIVARSRKPLGCILNVRHRYVWHRTDDGQPYQRCRRCGNDRFRGPQVGGIAIAQMGPSGG